MSVQALLKLHEGFRPKPYTCTAGKLTVGYGRNLDDRGLTEKEAAYLLEGDISEAVAHLRLEPYWLDLNEARQAVLIDMVVNLGWTKFTRFARMILAVRAKDYATAAAEMLNSKWAGQVGERSTRLAEMMRTGEWARDAR